MIELIVPPVIIIILSAVLVFFLSRAVRHAAEFDELPQPVQQPVSATQQRWLTGYTKGITQLKDKTQRLAQKRRITAAVEEAKTNRMMQEDVHSTSFPGHNVDQSQFMQSQKMSRMGEIILNYHRKASQDENREVNDPTEAGLIQSVERDPQNAESYERLGDFYMERQNFEDARECYKYVLRLDPRHRRAQEAMKNLDRVLA